MALHYKGYDRYEIADKLAGNDERKRKVVLGQITRMIATDPEMQEFMGLQSKGEIIASLPAMSEALVRRATKGNVPAIKLAYEASGFHNPRHEVQHSGEIQINIRMAERPPVVEDAITDATVVEED